MKRSELLLQLLVFAWALLAASDECFSQWPEVRLGLDGRWKVGFSTIARLTPNADASALQLAERYAIRSVDGDGVPIIYRWADNAALEQPTSSQLLVRTGRVRSRPQLIRLDDAGNAIESRTLEPDAAGILLPVDQPWIVAVAVDPQLDALVQRSATGGLETISVSRLAAVDDVPMFAEAYDGVDWLIISTRDIELLRSLDERQGQAIVDWVAAGGRAQIWIGENAAAAAQLPWLRQLLPGDVDQVYRGINPAPLETYLGVSDATALADLTVGSLVNAQAVVDLSLRGENRKSLPLLLRHSYGGGSVSTVTIDLDSPELLGWSERKTLLDRLLRTPQLLERRRNSLSVGLLGYGDVSGQIRSSLESFAAVFTPSISWLIAGILLFLAFIGPVDYFWHGRAGKRSARAWLVLPAAVVVLMSCVAVVVARGKPSVAIRNTLEILDVTPGTQQVVSRRFEHIYFGYAGRYNLRGGSVDLQQIGLKAGGTDAIAEAITWSGQPGAGLGGFESTVRVDAGMPTYASFQSVADEQLQTELVGVGVPAASSLAIRSQWRADGIDLGQSHQLQNYPGSDLLEGTFTNPLSVPLVQPLLAYENWAYRLPERIEPGQTIRVSVNDNPRDLMRQLQRRRTFNDKEISTPWDASTRDELPRLIELASLYEPAGGRAFVGLDLQYVSFLDWSEHLQRSRAVLLAQIDAPPVGRSVVQSQNESSPADEVIVEPGLQLSFVRFLLPVQDR